MITTTWSEAGFPNIRNIDYGIPMFILSNASKEYKYMIRGRYNEEERENYLRENCRKHLSSSPTAGYNYTYDIPAYPGTYLWDYYELRDMVVSLGEDRFSLWQRVYLSNISGDFDISGISQNDIIRGWTKTPNGPLFIDKNAGTHNGTNTYFFLAEFARQAYTILSGPLYAPVGVDTKYNSESNTWLVTVQEADKNFFDSAFLSPEYHVGIRLGSRGKVATGKSASFTPVTLADQFGFVVGKPKSSYWAGKS